MMRGPGAFGRALVALAWSMAMTGCHHRDDPAEKAAKDAHDVAMVEAVQHRVPPAQPIVPESLVLEDVRRLGFSDAACGYRDPAHAKGQTIAVLGNARAVMRLDGLNEAFASDPGASSVAAGAWSHYVGKRYSLKIERIAPLDPSVRATATPLPGGKGSALPVVLSVLDDHDRPVLRSEGQLLCGQ
jgi:hypothetical protein